MVKRGNITSHCARGGGGLVGYTPHQAGRLLHAVHLQCKLLYAGNYLNRSFALFSPVGCSIAGFVLRFLCIEDVAHLNCHPFSPIFTHFQPF